MTDRPLHHLVCDVCQTKFQHPTIRKTCSVECQKREREELQAAVVEKRRSLSKECPECHRVFTWEEMFLVHPGEGKHQFEIRTHCSIECSRTYQKKETAARNSINYHGVRLLIEDVRKLEQKDIQTIRLLMKKGNLPGAQWAEPELRAQYARPARLPGVPKDELIKVRVTCEQKDTIEAYARWRGATNGAEFLMMLVYQEMQRMPKS